MCHSVLCIPKTSIPSSMSCIPAVMRSCEQGMFHYDCLSIVPHCVGVCWFAGQGRKGITATKDYLVTESHPLLY